MPLIKKIFIVYVLVLALTVFFLPQMAKAQVTPPCVEKNGIPLQVSFPLPSTDYYKPCSCNPDRMCISDIGAYISTFYIYFAGVAGILATVMILFAGFTWITAAGNSSRIEKAKSTMNGAFIGLVLTLTSYIILRTINPELVKLRMPPLSVIKQQVLATNFCKDMPTVSGVTPVADADTIPCGQTRGINQATAEKSGYTQDYCCGSFCPKNLESPQICAIIEGMVTTDEDDCPETCVSAAHICESYDKDNCNALNDVLRSQNITNVACRKKDVSFGEDRCEISPILGCVQLPSIYTTGEPSRISCAYFGLANDTDTPCWSVHNPKKSSAGKTCTDYLYPTYESDAICCAYKQKMDISCRSECADHEIQVSCQSYNENEFNTEYKTGEIWCSDRCCMHLQVWGPGESDAGEVTIP